MLYDTMYEYEIKRMLKRAEYLASKRALVEVTDRSRLSLSQNNYMHVCFGIVALELGVKEEHAKQKWFKRIVNPDIFYMGKEIDPVTGEEYTNWRSSSSLTKEEASLAIDRWRNWSANEHGIYVPSSVEHATIRQATVELDKHKKWL